MPRLYHLVAINQKSGKKAYLTRYPCPHSECMTIKSKLTNHPFRRIQVEECKAGAVRANGRDFA